MTGIMPKTQILENQFRLIGMLLDLEVVWVHYRQSGGDEDPWEGYLGCGQPPSGLDWKRDIRDGRLVQPTPSKTG